MNAPDQATAKPAPTSSHARRIATCLIVTALVFIVLWLMALSVVTSLLISSGIGIVLMAGSSVSDWIETVLDAIATVIFAIFAVIAAVIAAIFSVFS